jgi:hypothetical protein
MSQLKISVDMDDSNYVVLKIAKDGADFGLIHLTPKQAGALAGALLRNAARAKTLEDSQG